MPQFDFTAYFSQIFWLVVIFGFLYVAVYKLLTPKAEQIFKNRQDIFEININEATDLSNKAELLKESYNATLKEIKEKAENIKKESIASLDLSFGKKKIKLTKELAIASEKAEDEVHTSIKSFQINEQSACESLAKFVIEKLSGKKTDLELFKKCYGKIK